MLPAAGPAARAACALLGALLPFAACNPSQPAAASPDMHTPAASGLLVDYKPSPAMGVSAAPLFSWVVPHLPPVPHCTNLAATNQLQHSYQLQVIQSGGHGAGVVGGAQVFARGTIHHAGVHDTGRVIAAQSSGVEAGLGLRAGTTYEWRVRMWASADASDTCASGWAHGRLTTALFVRLFEFCRWLGKREEQNHRCAPAPLPARPAPTVPSSADTCAVSSTGACSSVCVGGQGAGGSSSTGGGPLTLWTGLCYLPRRTRAGHVHVDVILARAKRTASPLSPFGLGRRAWRRRYSPWLPRQAARPRATSRACGKATAVRMATGFPSRLHKRWPRLKLKAQVAPRCTTRPAAHFGITKWSTSGTAP